MMKNMNAIKVLAFDWDGVHTDSNELKERGAWKEVFPAGGTFNQDLVWEAKKIAKEGTRYDILTHFFRLHGVPEEEIPSLVSEHANLFDAAVQKGMKALGLIEGVEETLKRLSSSYPLYVVSATPQEGIQKTVESLGLTHLYEGVYGIPPSKRENLAGIISRKNIEPGSLLYVGDDEKDYQATRDVDCRFVGIPNEFNGWKTDEKRFPLIPSFAHIQEILSLS